MLRRQRQRVYRRSGKSPKYLQIKKEFDAALLKAAHNYKDKIIEEVIVGKRGSAYKAIKKLAENKTTDDDFQIPAHVEANLSPQQCAESLADYFSLISQEFDPIDESRFSSQLRENLLSTSSSPPLLEEYQIHKKYCHPRNQTQWFLATYPERLSKRFLLN